MLPFATWYPSLPMLPAGLDREWETFFRRGLPVLDRERDLNRASYCLDATASNDAKLVCSFHFKTGHHKKNRNILGYEYYWNEILYLKCRQLSMLFKDISKSSKVSEQSSSVWFHLKEPNKRHDSKHLCDRNKREGMRMRMNDVLTVGLSCQLWPTSSNFLTIMTIMLEVSKYVIVSIASGRCRKIKSGHCRSLQTKRTQSPYWYGTVQSHKHEADT